MKTHWKILLKVILFIASITVGYSVTYHIGYWWREEEERIELEKEHLRLENELLKKQLNEHEQTN